MTNGEGFTRSSIMKDASFKRVLVGVLLAAALFFIEAGAAEILLAQDAQCLEAVERLRYPPSPAEFCLPEWQSLMLGAASRGVVGLFAPETGPVLSWAMMLLVYALLGGICTRLSPRWATVTFLALNLSLIALLAGLGYMSQYITGFSV